MKREKRLLAWLIVLVLVSVSVCAGAAVASATEEAPVQGCRYSYQLAEVPGSDGKQYNLYVERTNLDGKPLHAGSIALAVPIGADLIFTPDAGWETSSVPYGGSGGGTLPAPTAEKGVLTQGAYKDYHYISFGWYWGMDAGELPTGSAGGTNRQLLGILELAEGRELDQIWLLPWPQTNTGRAQVSDWQTAGDKEAFLEVIRNTWRMPNLDMPNEGYYQGFYASEDEELVNGGNQYAVDLTAGWYGFLISAYAPARPVTLRVYQKDESGQRQLVATASTAFGSGTGYFKGKIDFSKLQTTDGQALTAVLPDGTYELEITKVSHVKATFSGLTVAGDDVFPELLGVSVYLPCGDVNQDGMIRQLDRALLTVPSRYGKNIGTGTNETDMNFRCDLDGDQRVDQKDLSILTAPINYGKKDLHFQY